MQFISRVKNILFSRVIIVSSLILVQLLILLLFVLRLSQYFAVMYAFFLLISLLALLYIANKNLNASYKLAWIIPILLFPLFGGLFYLLLGTGRLSRSMKKMISQIEGAITRVCPQNPESFARLDAQSTNAYAQAQYITYSGHTLFEHTETIYHPLGEEKFAAMCRALKSAKRYIFLEYFIIEQGVMWDTILDILVQKVKEGVEVRVMYDGFGCLMTLPDGYYKTLQALGIQCIEFNPLVPVASLIMNHRDHRKILVVDGHTGFMGGVNLADEYINAVEKHGHWKDSAIELRGDAVMSLAVMFLSMWQGITGVLEEYDGYRPLPEEITAQDNGFVLPYSDSPLDNELVGEMTYLNIINRSKRYVYICTPYLIIDNETVTSLILAAKSGVDVRIVTPHKPDKWYVHMVTQAYYQQLIENGVKIYEYTPGFMHAKTFVADDEIATVGTVNLDYRSLYLHFECGVWMYNTRAVGEIRRDFDELMEVCTPITPDSEILNIGLAKRMLRAVLRLFAPLM